MAYIWLVLPFSISALLLIQLMPVRINLFFDRENKNDFLNIRVNTLFSLIRFTVEVPILQQETPLDVTLEAELKAGQDKLLREEKEKVSALDINWKKVKKLLAYLEYNRKTLKFIVQFYTRAITVEKMVLRVRAGVADAALTGLITGLYGTITNILSMVIQQRVRFQKKPLFMIDPDFSSEPVFAVKFDTVIALRFGHATVVGLLLLWTIIRGGLKKL